MNHFEVRLSQNRMEVWGTDAGSSALKQLAVADNSGLTFTKGLVWLDDVHYNARKAIEPCECGTQYNHTFAWDNLGFDGPKTYRDLGFDVPDANVAGGSPSLVTPPAASGISVGPAPVTLSVTGVHHDQTPTGALVVFNTWSFDHGRTRRSASTVGHGSTPHGCSTARPTAGSSLAIPVPLDQIHDGTNTIAFKSSDGSHSRRQHLHHPRRRRPRPLIGTWTTRGRLTSGRSGRAVRRRGYGREGDDGEEEVVDLADDLDELVEVDGLGDERVGMEVVAAEDVLFGLRRGQHDDGDLPQLRVGLDDREQLAAVEAGQVEVEQDQIRPPDASANSPSWRRNREGLLAVADRVEVCSSAGCARTLRG